MLKDVHGGDPWSTEGIGLNRQMRCGKDFDAHSFANLSRIESIERSHLSPGCTEKELRRIEDRSLFRSSLAVCSSLLLPPNRFLTQDLHPRFEGLTPDQILETGGSDRIWRMTGCLPGGNSGDRDRRNSCRKNCEFRTTNEDHPQLARSTVDHGRHVGRKRKDRDPRRPFSEHHPRARARRALPLAPGQGLVRAATGTGRGDLVVHLQRRSERDGGHFREINRADLRRPGWFCQWILKVFVPNSTSDCIG